MASPFAVFRRNQRVLIAVAGLMAMIAFVFLDPRISMFGGSRGPENPVIVKTNYGNFERSELSLMNYQREMVRMFLERVIMARVRLEVVDQKRVPEQMAQRYAEQFRSAVLQELFARSQPVGDAATIETLVLAKRAEQLGMVVTDRTVNDLLTTVAGDALDQVRSIIAGLKPDGRVPISEGRLFESLRRELLASRLAMMFTIGTASRPPGQRWHYFKELNQKADAQVLAVPVEGFLKDVPQPPDEKLIGYFERYQNQLPDPNSPEPGFKEPQRISFQYFKANLEQFIERAEPTITDEETHAYYEKNKASRFKVLELPADEKKTEAEKAGDEAGPPAEDKTGEAAPGEEPTEGPESNGPESSKPSPGDAKPDAAPAKPKSSDARPPVRFRLVAGAAQKPAAGVAKPAPAAEEAAGSTGAKAAAGDAAEAPADNVEPGSGEPSEGQQQAETEPKYEPYEKVAEEVRKQLGREKGQEALDKAFDRLRSRMREYGSSYSAYLANREEDSDQPPPEKLDFSALAKEFDVTYEIIELASAYEVETQSDLGKSNNFVADQRLGFRQVSFVEMAYIDGHIYRPDMSFDDENNHYLWWETEIVPETVPSFESARSTVLHAYKMGQARELARKRTEAMAEEARKAKKPLKDVFAGREGMEVVETQPFTRLTMGSVAYDPEASQPRLSPVHGVDAAGEKFMDAVFSARPGEIVVTMNEPQTMAYVVEVQEFSPPRDLLQHEFLLEPFQKYAQLASEAQHKQYVNWINGLESEAGVEWLETPRTDRTREE